MTIIDGRCYTRVVINRNSVFGFIVVKHFKNSRFNRIITDIRCRVRDIIDKIRRIFIVDLVVRTVQEMSADDATHMAAGVAYYALFSLFPLLLGLIAVFSFFLESDTVRAELTEFVIDFLPGSEAFVHDNVQAVFQLRGALGLVAILGLLWSGSAIFGAVNRAVNRAWDVHQDRPFYIGKPRQLVMALGIGILFVLSTGIATFVRVAGRLAEFDVSALAFLVDTLGRVLLQGSSFLFTLMIFLILYKYLPNTRTYWRFIWPGAVVAGGLFELAKYIFITYLNAFATYDTVYGSIAPVIVLLVWTYVSALILILGAELSSEYGRLKTGTERGMLLQSKE